MTGIDWSGMSKAEQKARDARLLPKRRERVARLCPNGHAFTAEEYPRCNRCTYHECELIAWGLAKRSGDSGTRKD